jgi:hypothetical protein
MADRASTLSLLSAAALVLTPLVWRLPLKRGRLGPKALLLPLAAVAYPEIFQIFAGTVMNQAGKEVETIIIVMAIFLTVNLIFSAFMNWYNSRIALVER